LKKNPRNTKGRPKQKKKKKKMVNINIELPDEIHKRIKILAAMSGKPIKEIFVEALEESVSDGKK
jgi:hypothetical protein